MTTQEKLERLHNGPTRYELIGEGPGGERVLIAYSMRTGRLAVLQSMQKHGPKIIELLGLDDKAMLTWEKPAARGARIGAWSFRFSGRTQRDAISNGELPWIGDESRKECAA